MATGVTNTSNASLVNNATNLIHTLSHIPWTEVVYTLITIAVALVATKLIFAVLKKKMETLAKQTKTKLDDILVRELEGPIHAIILLLALWLSLSIYPGMQKYLTFFDAAIQALLILAAAYFTTKLVKGFVVWYISENKSKRHTHNYLIVVRKLVNVTIYILAILMVLSELGIDITPLIASLGVGGLAVALAFQDTFANYFSGIYISTDRDLNIGDYIEVTGLASGTIVEIGWRSTKIKTWDGNLVLIPNKALAESTIIDYSKPKEPITVPFEVAVSYDTKSDNVIKTLKSIIKNIKKKHPDLLTDNEPTIRIERFDDSNIAYKVLVEVTNRTNKYKFMGIFNKAVAEAYEKGKLKVDYPVVKLIR